MRPSARPSSRWRSMRTTTRSPCSASLQVVRGDVDVARQAFDGPLGRDEAEAGRMAIELADHEVHAIGQAVAVAFDLDQRAVVDEVREIALEAGPLVARDLEHAQQFARGGRMRHALPHQPK